MPNQHVLQRLAGIQAILNGVHRASGALTANTRGQERQAFIDSFLSNVFPPIYRFGTGDATDKSGNRSGQLDVVVEFPFSPTVPAVGGTPTTRLYLADSVAAVVEVKSDVSRQWNEAQHTAAQLAPLRRTFGSSIRIGGIPPTQQIPLFVAGYTGWSNVDTAKRNLDQSPDISGVLVIDSGIFVSSNHYLGLQATGATGLWCLISVLHLTAQGLLIATPNPLDYVL